MPNNEANPLPKWVPVIVVATLILLIGATWFNLGVQVSDLRTSMVALQADLRGDLKVLQTENIERGKEIVALTQRVKDLVDTINDRKKK